MRITYELVDEHLRDIGDPTHRICLDTDSVGWHDVNAPGWLEVWQPADDPEDSQSDTLMLRQVRDRIGTEHPAWGLCLRWHRGLIEDGHRHLRDDLDEGDTEAAKRVWANLRPVMEELAEAIPTQDIHMLLADCDRDDVLATRDELVALEDCSPAVVEDTAGDPVALVAGGQLQTASQAIAQINDRYAAHVR